MCSSNEKENYTGLILYTFPAREKEYAQSTTRVSRAVRLGLVIIAVIILVFFTFRLGRPVSLAPREEQSLSDPQ
jgi:hypothetical protein